jgi:hypothetical protein
VIGEPRLRPRPSVGVRPLKIYPVSVLVKDGLVHEEWNGDAIAGTLDSLIDDHRKKLDNHIARRAKLIEVSDRLDGKYTVS